MKTDAERIAWLKERCHTIANIIDGLEDEGDRVYFGSTNDADALRQINDELVSFWYWHEDSRDG